MMARNDLPLGKEGAMAGLDDPVARHGHSVVLAPGAGRAIALGDAQTVTLKTVASDSDGTLSAFEVALAPITAGPPLHLHRTWDEAFYVLEGEMSFLIDGRTHTAPAGSFVFVPRGILHTFWNASDAPAKQLIVFTPAGIEAYFEQVTQVLAGGGEEALDAAAALMAKHDMIVPPETRPAYGALTPADRREG
jgi:quercetin dioxygenase-like cupin family protein